MKLRSLIAGVCATTALLFAAPLASAATETASSGDISAKFSYKGNAFPYKDLRLQIFRSGVLSYDAKITSKDCDGCLPGPGAPFGGKSLNIKQLDSTAEPEVVLDLFSGGAHCCVISRIYRFLPDTGSYEGLTQNWLDAGYRFIDPEKDGVTEFMSHDARFAYIFGSFAESWFPPQVFSYQDGSLVDVSSDYPAFARKDIQRVVPLIKRIKKAHQNLRTTLAGYTADQCILGDCDKGFAYISKITRQGGFGDPPGTVGPIAVKFIKRLEHVLKNFGYR